MNRKLCGGIRSERDAADIALPARVIAIGLATALPLSMMNLGCATAATMGVKLVGSAVHTADVDAQSKKLLGKPMSAADAEFGQRVNTFDDTRSRREMATYKVSGDAFDQYRWVVESQDNRIEAVAKAQFNADMGKDIIQKALLKDKVIGKTPQEIEGHSTFKKLILVVRHRPTGRLVRVYDVRGITDLMGARYCVVDFDKSDRGQGIRLVGVPASAGNSALKQ